MGMGLHRCGGAEVEETGKKLNFILCHLLYAYVVIRTNDFVPNVVVNEIRDLWHVLLLYLLFRKNHDCTKSETVFLTIFVVCAEDGLFLVFPGISWNDVVGI